MAESLSSFNSFSSRNKNSEVFAHSDFKMALSFDWSHRAQIYEQSQNVRKQEFYF